MEIKKYKSAEVLYHIRHNLRELPQNRSYGNESIIPDLTRENYQLLDRGSSQEVNEYRKRFENGVHIYNRKDIVHAIEIVIQVPTDCPPDQHEEFFRAVYGWIQDDYIKVPKAILNAVVHRDEKHYAPDGKMISKAAHMHVLIIPVVEDKKHADYDYKLCASALTSKTVLRGLHSSLQKKLNDSGIQATVVKKNAGDGKTIPLTVEQLKEITAKTGVTIDHTLTVEELGEILAQSKELTNLRKELAEKSHDIAYATEKLEAMKAHEETIQHAYAAQKEKLVDAENKIAELEEKNKELIKERSLDRSWGDSTSTWATEKTNEEEKEILW